jgi:hypothetical protein
MENTADIEVLKATAKDLAQNSLEKAKSIATQATEKSLEIGEQLASSSIDALESVGRSAVKLLATQEPIAPTNDSQPPNDKDVRGLFN